MNIYLLQYYLFFLDQRDSESPQDLSRDTLAEKEHSINEEDSKSEDPSSPPTTPRPGPSPLISFSPHAKNNNPLQQMVTITNSLTALPPPPLGSPNSPMSAAAASFRNNGGRPTNKVTLPPISQEQFDKYTHINTELLVRKVYFSYLRGFKKGVLVWGLGCLGTNKLFLFSTLNEGLLRAPTSKRSCNVIQFI